MDIPYAEREEIRFNYVKYPSFSSKAKRVFELFNNSKCLDRPILVKYFKELGRHDLKNEIPPMEHEVFYNLEFLYPLTRVLLEPSIYAVLANVIIS